MCFGIAQSTKESIEESLCAQKGSLRALKDGALHAKGRHQDAIQLGTTDE